jgi:hypothetical protein
VDGTSNVYVADTYNHRVQTFTTAGVFQNKWGTFGSGAGQFVRPISVAVDGLGNVYVADNGNARIQKFGTNQTPGAPVSVGAPAGSGLSLAWSGSNPAVREVRVSLTLDSSQPASLEMFDVRGSRVLARAVGGMGAGSHSVTLSGEPGLGVGLYLVRLSQAGRSVSVKGVVLR